MTPPRSSTTLDHVAIVIPARNEQRLIARCLRAVHQCVATTNAHLGTDAPNIVTVVAVDSSDDDTEAIAGSFDGVSVLTIAACNVGAARRAGVAAALESLVGDDPNRDLSRVWIASTDADSAVSPTWLLEQLALADHGTDVMVGTVRPDFADLTAPQVEAWLRAHPPGVAHGTIHGANLGVRASFYDRAGGFAALTEHEDVDLVARLTALDARLTPSAAAEVLTSGRQTGRTPGGFAGYLRTELVPPAA